MITIRKKFIIEKIFIFIISSILVFATSGHHVKEGVSDVAFILTDIFFSPLFHQNFFSLFEVILLLFFGYVSIKSKVYLINSSKKEKIIFLSAVLCFLLNMINPNTNTRNPILGMPLFSNFSEYTFLLFLYVYLFVKSKKISCYLILFFKYLIILSFIRGFFILIGFIIGIGTIRFGRVITLQEYDVLLQYSLLMGICFTIYVLRKEYKFLISAILFFMIVFLSTTRSIAMPGIIAIIGFLFVYITKANTSKKIKIILSGLIIIVFFIINFKLLPDSFKKTYYRTLSIFPSLALESSGEFSDTGHFFQSSYTTMSILSKKTFWGKGYGNYKEVYLYGQSGEIHNAYAAMWIKHGLHMVVFYFLILLIVIYEIIRILKVKNNKLSYLQWYKLTLCFYCIGFAISAYFSTASFYLDIRRQFFYFSILAFIIRVKKEDYNHAKYFIAGK